MTDGRSYLPVNDRCVATYVYAERNGVEVGGFIRADGAAVWPLSKRAFPMWDCNEGGTALIIDVIDADDGGDSRLQRRIGSYQRRGWSVKGPVDVTLGRPGKRPTRT